MTMLEPFLAQVARDPERVALIDRHGAATTFGRLSRESSALADAWRARGIGPGDRILMAVPVSAALYAALIAVWRLGAVAVFPEPALGFAGLRLAAGATRPKAFCAPRWLRLLALAVADLRAVPIGLSPAVPDGPAEENAVAALANDAPALISFTSGSTGRAKAMARSHGLLLAQHAAVGRLLAPEREAERDLVWFPVFVLANLGLGVASVLPPAAVRRPDAADPIRLARHMRDHGVTRLLAPPSVCARLADAQVPLDLRHLFVGGGPVFPDLLDRLTDWLPSARIHLVYGSTEAEPIAHLDAAAIADSDRRAMAGGAGLIAGPPVPGIRVRLIDDEIVVAGAHVNPGYLDPADDAETKIRDGDTVWHRTGDAGRLDEQGRLWLLGRLAGRSGGLFPFAVEAAARRWPGVRQAALTEIDGRPVLAIAGERRRHDAWAAEAGRLGVAIRTVSRIPLDRRHGSKVDYRALARQLG